MPWTRPTMSELVTRIENDITSRLTGNAPLLRRALLKIMARVWAAVFHILYGLIQNESRNILVTTAETDKLDEHGSERGVTRIAASPASGPLLITGDNGTVVPLGVVFVADSGLEYRTIETGTISGGVLELDVQCTSFGTQGNLPDEAELTIQIPAAGIDDLAETNAAFTNGVDEETDEAYRARILEHIQNPPAGGSRADFIRWAKSVAGVGDAWCFPNYYGAGTVGVAIKATDAAPQPSGALVTQVQTYIDQDTIRPVTMEVTVSGVVQRAVVFGLTITPDTAEARAAIQDNLKSLLERDIAPGGNGDGTDVLYLSHIRKAISLANVLDYSINTLTIGGSSQPIANYTFPAFDYPLFSSITWT